MIRAPAILFLAVLARLGARLVALGATFIVIVILTADCFETILASLASDLIALATPPRRFANGVSATECTLVHFEIKIL